MLWKTCSKRAVHILKLRSLGTRLHLLHGCHTDTLAKHYITEVVYSTCLSTSTAPGCSSFWWSSSTLVWMVHKTSPIRLIQCQSFTFQFCSNRILFLFILESGGFTQRKEEGGRRGRGHSGGSLSPPPPPLYQKFWCHNCLNSYNRGT